ncbi:MAG TPA: molybdate ABC transporter substrate-binding protein [Steroidobacteraceae bacterium]|jgi:molybdate transport system substrate-binding protein
MRHALRILGLLTFFCATAVPVAVGAEEPKALLVFGASSLTNVLDDLDQAYTAKTKVPVKGSYAASSALAKQIEQGAPADIFFSADTDWVDYLDQRKLLKAGTRKDVVSNRLVLIAPADSTVQIKIGPHFDLAGILADSRLATGDPDSVPVGKYAAAALTRLGVWDAVSSKLARAENVRAALAFVARGEAKLGIVYETDAKAEPKVKVVGVFPADTHPPITYPIALTDHAQPGAEKFEAFVMGAEGQRIFRKYGFTPIH